MNTAMELHDSWILEFRQHPDGSGHLLFNGVVYQNEGIPGVDLPQVSGWQNVRISFENLIFSGPPFDDHCYVSDGSLWLNSVKDDGLITYPLTHIGQVSLVLSTSHDFVDREITASKVSIHSEGEFDTFTYWHADGTTSAIKHLDNASHLPRP